MTDQYKSFDSIIPYKWNWNTIDFIAVICNYLIMTYFFHFLQ